MKGFGSAFAFHYYCTGLNDVVHLEVRNFRPPTEQQMLSLTESFAISVAQSLHSLSRKNTHPFFLLTCEWQRLGVSARCLKFAQEKRLALPLSTFYSQKPKLLLPIKTTVMGELGKGAIWMDNFNKRYIHHSLLKGCYIYFGFSYFFLGTYTTTDWSAHALLLPHSCTCMPVLRSV